MRTLFKLVDSLAKKGPEGNVFLLLRALLFGTPNVVFLSLTDTISILQVKGGGGGGGGRADLIYIEQGNWIDLLTCCPFRVQISQKRRRLRGRCSRNEKGIRK